MTRFTNVGRKRTYIEAGFNSDEPVAEPSEPVSELKNPTEDVDLPPKQKRKRTKRPRSKIAGDSGQGMAEVRETDDDGKLQANDAEGESASTNNTAPMSNIIGKGKDSRQKGLVASERRRKKRISEKLSAIICFACRTKGHAAKDCPNNKVQDEEGDNIKSKGVIGICYRCGSTRHTLSRCKKASNHEDPLPFASCFVCSGKGHLASSCPQNKTKGIYPNGGCCKLCGDSSHLAKNCGLRTQSGIDSTAILGTGREAGADEDDFHIFKRQTIEMDRGDKAEEKNMRLLRIKAGTQTSRTESVRTEKSSVKKVVYF